ncbi:MAG: endo-1,4-beta-xylanase [Paludibacter sp.]|nr:endo-1,4-beta-xylanase [Paludibacter sp.]
MRNIRLLIQLALVIQLVGFTACYDEKMDWISNPYGAPIDITEIPPTLQEQITALDVLKAYANTFDIGVGLDLTRYLEKEDYRNTINANFHNITVGYHMKHAPMVNTNDGTLRFTAVDNFLERLPAEMEVYGHTLVWHQNQNGAYLRSLIAPTVIPPDPTENNILSLSGLKDKSFTGWIRQNPGAGISIDDNGGIKAGEQAIKLISTSSSVDPWQLQLRIPIVPVVSGKKYTISFYIRSNQAGEGRISFEKGHDSNKYPYIDWYRTGSAVRSFTTNSAWQNVSFDITMEDSQFQFNLDLGYVSDVTYFIDINNFTITDSERVSEPTFIEKTAEEKKQIVTNAMNYWITEMVGHYKNRVNDWDVVNEPINDSGSGIRHGNNKGDSEDIFHWQDFMGDDYAAEAFKIARAAAKPGDKLFINDFNLEYNLNKCQKLIEYVNHIESLGAQVDGIGTQMHIDINQNMEDMAEMFRLLAATGKLIKITELDVKVNTASPDTKVLTTQGAVYFQVVKLFKEIIPPAQQYGITIWGVTDADSWIEGDAPCIWDEKYKRKVAYKGLADGLAGLQESIEFPK